MSNPLSIAPSVMIDRMARADSISLATQLANVARLRLDLAKAESERCGDETGSTHRATNGAEVDLLI